MNGKEELYVDELEDTVRMLCDALEWSIEELQGWWNDQGNYGTGGYEERVPQLRHILRKAKEKVE